MILNDEVSCLKKCLDIVFDLTKNKKATWTDDEFGSSQAGLNGERSMYFCSNKIP